MNQPCSDVFVFHPETCCVRSWYSWAIGYHCLDQVRQFLPPTARLHEQSLLKGEMEVVQCRKPQTCDNMKIAHMVWGNMQTLMQCICSWDRANRMVHKLFALFFASKPSLAPDHLLSTRLEPLGTRSSQKSVLGYVRVKREATTEAFKHSARPSRVPNHRPCLLRVSLDVTAQIVGVRMARLPALLQFEGEAMLRPSFLQNPPS